MARKTKEDKRIEAAVDAAFTRHSSNVQFDVFNVGKVLDAGRTAGKNGQDIEAAVIAAIQQYKS